MKKVIVFKISLLAMLSASPFIQADDNTIDANAIIKSLDLGNSVAPSSGKQGVIGKMKDHKGDNFNSEQFNKAFREGASSANEVGLPLANGRELKTLASYSETSVNGAQGAWKFSVNGWEGEAYSEEVRIYQAPGVMANYGNRFEYVFYLPTIQKRYVDRVDAKLETAKKNLSKSGKNVVVTYPKTEAGQLSVHAAFSYDAKTSTGTLKEHVEQLLLNSRGLFNEYLVESKKAEADYLKELRKSSPANLGKEEFFQMLEDFSGFKPKMREDDIAGTADGFAFYSWSKIDVMIWNYKTNFTIGSVVYPSTALNQSQKDSLLQSWKEWGIKEFGNEAKAIDVILVKDGDTEMRVLTVNYPLDGTLKGSKIEELYMDFLKKGLPDANKEFEKLQKKALK